MKTLLQYISSIEKTSLNEYINEDNNLDKVQMEVDDMKSNESDQLSKIDADAVKSLIIDSDFLGNLITIVSKKGNTYSVKFNKNDFIVDGKISDTIIKICKYFKETMGAKEIKIDNKKYILEIS
jgi:S-adenosylmethionine hydrolase